MSSSVTDRLAEIRDQAPVENAWLVGGSVRDLLLGRPVIDIDLVVDADPGRVARGLAGTVGGSPFPLSERHGAWRVVGDGRTIDVTRSRGTLEQDLRLRDFTINAIAIPLAGGDAVDPAGGRADLDAGLLRAVSDAVFDDDPLRLLRLPRWLIDLSPVGRTTAPTDFSAVALTVMVVVAIALSALAGWIYRSRDAV